MDKKESARIASRKYKSKNPDKVLERGREYRQENKDAINAKRRQARKTNPAVREKEREYEARTAAERAKKSHDYYLNVQKARMDIRHRHQRLQIIMHYAGVNPKCNYCGESWYPCLELDHVNGDGHKDKSRTNRRAKNHKYAAIIKNGFVENLQVLCGSCNRVKRTMNDKEFRHAYPDRIR